jgi:hypothetical protein
MPTKFHAAGAVRDRILRRGVSQGCPKGLEMERPVPDELDASPRIVNVTIAATIRAIAEHGRKSVGWPEQGLTALHPWTVDIETIQNNAESAGLTTEEVHKAIMYLIECGAMWADQAHDLGLCAAEHDPDLEQSRIMMLNHLRFWIEPQDRAEGH